MKTMKWFLAAVTLCAALCRDAATAQSTNGAASQVPDLMSAQTNSVPTLQGGIDEIIQAFKEGTTNSYWVAYGLKANGLQHKYGGGLGWFEPINTYVVTGIRLDYVDGDFWMPSGSATLQLPIKVSSFLTITPLAYAGVGIPVSGATITTSLGTATIPGHVRDNNGQPTAILGTGAAVKIYNGANWDLNAVGDVEKWTGFNGDQYRIGLAYHSNKPGLFGVGLNLGGFQL